MYANKWINSIARKPRWILWQNEDGGLALRTKNKFWTMRTENGLPDSRSNWKLEQPAVVMTSSKRLDKQTIEMRQNTNNNFVSLYADHWKLGKILHVKMKQLLVLIRAVSFINLVSPEQVFDCLSTYSLCRSFSSTIRDIACRPYTIRTLCEYDSPQESDSQPHRLSNQLLYWLSKTRSFGNFDEPHYSHL